MSGDGGEEDQVAKVEASAPISTITTATTTTATNNTSSSTTLQPTAEPVASSSSSVSGVNAAVTLTTTTTACTATPSATWTSPTVAAAAEDGVEEEEGEEEGSTADEPSSSPERILITAEQLAVLTREEMVEKWVQQEKFIDSLQAKMDALEREVEELRGVRENEERLKGQLAEIQRKEQYHIMRLSSKEHELQDMGAQIQELKSMSAGMSGLKHCLLDPAVNLLFERLKRDLDTARTKMEETQNELSAWKFTPDSNTGKQLMAKCRLLIKENEELGRMISSGRLAKLEGDLALQRNFSEELKKSQSELDEFLLEMDEDTEGMQGTIYYLQQQLRQAKERITQLTGQLAVTQTPGTQAVDDSSSLMATEGASDVNSEAERTEERTQVPQPNGDTSHYEPQTNSEVSDRDTAATPLTNGRKRTQSEIDEGTEVAEGGNNDTGEEYMGEAGGVAPRKRTRTDSEADAVAVSGGGEESTVVENGVMESE
ncbi:pre-mRNA-splicing regulator WTAP-like [Penaeus japonicus]|uniref:pre-mRNA-splicing regulator WTAP-like n=1 Tax=Penaeus japonicus TaxID=27405 RepID=UPI001C717558|nr:pre-mRNA-splicing regulator WTAP-like [Penaeus japonicus]